MRTIAIAVALMLGLVTAGSASAAPRHGKKHHHAAPHDKHPGLRK